MADVTKILSQIEAGNQSVTEELFVLVYDELKQLAAGKLACEKPGQMLQATALVHEAYLRLVEAAEQKPVEQPWPFFRRRRQSHATNSCRRGTAQEYHQTRRQV